MAIPLIDQRVRYVGTTALRSLNTKALRDLEDVMVFQVDETPVAVLVPYEMYLKMQQAVWPASLLPSLERFLSQEPEADIEKLSSQQSVGDGDHASWNPPAPPTLTAIGTSMTPRGAKFSGRIDPSAEPVFDDIDEPPVSEAKAPALTEDLIRKEIDELPYKKAPNVTALVDDGVGPRCQHCGKLNPLILCSDCFMAGHRENCVVCPKEGAQTK